MKNNKLKSIAVIVTSITLFFLIHTQHECNLPNSLVIFFSGMGFFKGITSVMSTKGKSIKEYNKTEKGMLIIALIISLSIVIITLLTSPSIF